MGDVAVRPGSIVTGVLAALGLGAVVGGVFAVTRLPVPAPGTLAGVAGVVGLFAGWEAVTWLLGRLS